MAEMIKEIKTRVALRTGDYAYWTTGAGKDIELYKGEVCICTIDPKGHPYDDAGQETGKAHTAPTVLFKVANANGQKFADLNWCSALAADVYDWAKKSQDEFITWVNTVVEHPVITIGSANGTIAVDGVDVAVKGLGSAAYTDATAYATSAENGAKQAADKAQKTIDDYAEAHKNDYTNTQIDQAIAAVDTGVHAVALTSGTNNGTVKLTVDGVATDNIAVTGLQDAAYTTVESLNATAKGYADAVEAKIPTEVGVMSVANADDTITVGGDGKAVTIKVTENKFDAYGAAAAVLGESTDGAAANTVYGAKAAAAAAQSDATIAKTKIETFLGTITPDGSKEIIDTLTEINNYVGKHGEEFAALSEKVTNIENGTTVVPKASDADTLDGKHAVDFADATENGAKALAQGVKDVVDANKETWDKAGAALQAADLADYAKSADVTKEISEAISGEIVRADDKYETKTDAAQKLTDAKAYTDEQVADAKDYADQAANNALDSAKGYTDGKATELGNRITNNASAIAALRAENHISKVEADTGLKVIGGSDVKIDQVLERVDFVDGDTNITIAIPEAGTYYIESLLGQVTQNGTVVANGTSSEEPTGTFVNLEAGSITVFPVWNGHVTVYKTVQVQNKVAIDDEVIFVLNCNF